MKTPFIHLLLALLLVLSSSGIASSAENDDAASVEHGQVVADEMASAVKMALYTLDNDQLMNVVVYALKVNRGVKALTIIEAIGDEALLTFHRRGNEEIYNQPIPDDLLSLNHYSAPVVFQGEKIGVLNTYYSDVSSDVVDLTSDEQAWVKEHPVLRVANELDWQPFDFAEEGKPMGYSIDLIRLIGEKAGFKPEFVNGYTWAELLERFKAGEIDIMPAIYENEERKSFLAFTKGYYSQPWSIVVKNDRQDIRALSDLSGMKLAIIKGYSITEAIKNDQPDIQIVEVKDPVEGIRRVSLGTVDAFIDTFGVIASTVDNFFVPNIKFINDNRLETLASTDLRMGVSTERTLLRDILDKGLASLTKEEKSELHDRWLKTSLVELTPDERSWIQDHPVIRVHNEKDWAPFNYFEFGQPRGLSIDYMNLLAKKLGIGVEYLTGPSWGEFLGLIKKKELDVILNVVRTEDRLKYLLYTDPYASNPNIIVSTTENPYDSIKQLFGKTVAFPKGFFYEEVLTKSFPQIKRLPVEDALASLKAVSYGKADAALGEEAVMNSLIAKNTLTGLWLSGEVEIGNPDLVNLRIGVRDDWPLLRQMLTKAMARVTPAEMNQIRDKWLGSVQSEDIFVLTEAEKKWLAGHKEMRLGVDPGWAPFEYLDEKGEYSGISSDYTRLLSKKLDVAMVPVKRASWAEIIVRAKRGEIDLLPAVIRTEEREKFLNFTEPYLSMPMVVVTREDAPFINSLADLKLKGKPLAVVQGYATQAFLERDYPEQPLYLAKNLGDALEAVSEGRAQAVMDSLPSIEFAKKRLGLTGLKVAATTEYATEIAFGVRKDWPELVPILDKALASFSNQEQAIIQDKWVNLRVSEHVDWSFIIKAILLVVAVVGIILFIVIRSNRRLALAEVKARESEARSKAFIESTPDALVTVNREGVIVLVNTQTERLFGYPREELQGQKVEMLVPEDIRAVHPKYRDEYFTDPRAKSLSEREGREFYGVAKDGRHIPVDISLSPVETSEGTQVIAAIRDVTERKESEAAMRENLNDLEQFSKLAVGREERMIALKEEINALLQEMGRPPKYKIVE